jgi:carboxylesterase type B
MRFVKNQILVILSVISAVTCVSPVYIPKENEVDTKNGRLEGEARGSYYAFEGIRYAEPPLGENRFEPPKPYSTKWEGVLPAKNIGSTCIQWDILQATSEDKMSGDEDCLFLNVYKPTTLPTAEPLPVIVHIHGGGFMFGSGAFYGPELIMKSGKFIYVSFNYRLGPLGFLSTKNELIPGNMGLKDQVIALKWVQENIQSFGGDKDSITLTGFSAGGAAVHLHYMSPLSTGLFHRGISHSGNALAPWVLTENAVDKFTALAEKLNCSHENQKEVVKCLKSVPGTDIVRTIPKFGESIGPVYKHPLTPFGIVVEPAHVNAFISKTPITYLQESKIQKLPWLLSTVKDEAAFITAELYQYPQFLQRFDENWNLLAPLLLDYNTTSQTNKDRVSAKLKEEYFTGHPVNKKNFSKLTKVSAFENLKLFYIGRDISQSQSTRKTKEKTAVKHNLNFFQGILSKIYLKMPIMNKFIIFSPENYLH